MDGARAKELLQLIKAGVKAREPIRFIHQQLRAPHRSFHQSSLRILLRRAGSTRKNGGNGHHTARSELRLDPRAPLSTSTSVRLYRKQYIVCAASLRHAFISSAGKDWVAASAVDMVTNLVVTATIETPLETSQQRLARQRNAPGCGEDHFQSLEGGTISKKTFFSDMEDVNDSSLMMMRIVGLLLTWLAVYCCFAPIAGAIDVGRQSCQSPLDDAMAFMASPKGNGDPGIRAIPCLGQFLEDLLEGMVTCILCVVSCGFGCSSGLFVIAVVWLYMRPLVGLGLMAFCAALAAGVYFLGQKSKEKEGRSLANEMVPLSNEA
eukprot:Skav214988  [mRNA]  locus=scaffold508:282856:291660:+ [translate_table: standard]